MYLLTLAVSRILRPDVAISSWTRLRHHRMDMAEARSAWERLAVRAVCPAAGPWAAAPRGAAPRTARGDASARAGGRPFLRTARRPVYVIPSAFDADGRAPLSAARAVTATAAPAHAFRGARGTEVAATRRLFTGDCGARPAPLARSAADVAALIFPCSGTAARGNSLFSAARPAPGVTG